MKSKNQPSKTKEFQANLKFLFYVLLFLGTKTFAQSPELTVKDSDSSKVRMSQLLVNVKIVGNIAYTTAEMHFFNSGNRQMEAELIFPLPENVSVSRYAIDINGKMREAVPVNKNKGKQVFEAIEHRRVDPGLLEKVDGNNFRTRIYPLMPNGERIVIIGYEEELSSFDKNNLVYQLASRYPKKLDKFEINVSVLGTSSSPTIAEHSVGTIFSQWNHSFQASSLKKQNYQPAEQLLFKIPIQEKAPGVLMQNVGGQHYFYGTTFIEGNKNAKNLPNSMGLIWDISLSYKSRNLKKELDLLDAYFQKIKNANVTLYFLSYNFEKQQDFIISNGNWETLKSYLRNAKYDGGTRYSQIHLSGHDEYLFFTDGLSSLSENTLPKIKKPLYTITSSASADFAFLNYASMQTGGSFINLNQSNLENALYKLVNTNLKFLGIKENYTITDVFPMQGTAVSGSFSFSGISLKPNNEVTLLFGYGDGAVLERKITLDATVQNTDDVNIEKLWAQKKIANLNLQYAKNAEEIENLGKKYGIVTNNISLIVLEDIQDYIAYDIVPPAELRAEFDRIKKQEQEGRLAKQKSNWQNVERYFTELNNWWKKDRKYVAPKYLPKSKRRMVNRSARESMPNIVENAVEYGSAAGESSRADAPQADKISYSVSEVQANKIAERKEISTQLNSKVAGINVTQAPNNDMLNIRGMASTSQTKEPLIIVDGKVFVGKLSDIDQEDIKSMDVIKDATATAMYGSSGANEVITITTKEGDYKNNIAQNEVKEWSPDRLYLKALASAPKEKQYELYLELRKVQEHNPSYYFDVAHFFYNQGNVKMALQVISNTADLGLENHQLYKTLTYILRQWSAHEDALFTAKQIVKWRAHEPQSHRELALAFEDNQQYQNAFDELIKALEVNYYGEMSGQYEGVEDIILMDINRLVAENKNINIGKLDKKYVAKMPVGIRIIMNWNQMDTDLDLHIIEPNGEECYYGHKDTEAGARFSKDFTQGYGPEQYLIRNAIKGKYRIKTNYYGESTLTENGPATVMVEIYVTKAGKTTRTLKTIQLGKIKENEILAEIVW